MDRSELARVPDAQFGTIQSVTRDRAKTALFTIPWRKAPESADETEPVQPPAPATESAPATR